MLIFTISFIFKIHTVLIENIKETCEVDKKKIVMNERNRFHIL
jgi:hypothetical protein